MELTPLEARVIGCLLEKEVTTPEQYPLSLNALTSACNQKTSREPVMALSETQVQETIDGLNKKRLISEQSGFGSRVVKYKHRFCNTEFSDLQLTPAEFAIICLLLLRGPQTAGELRTRSNRLYSFSDIKEVETSLQGLANRSTPLVQQLAKEIGRREVRYTQLFTPVEELLLTDKPPIPATVTPRPIENPDLASRVSELEQQVELLTQELQALKVGLGE